MKCLICPIFVPKLRRFAFTRLKLNGYSLIVQQIGTFWKKSEIICIKEVEVLLFVQYEINPARRKPIAFTFVYNAKGTFTYAFSHSVMHSHNIWRSCSRGRVGICATHTWKRMRTKRRRVVRLWGMSKWKKWGKWQSMESEKSKQIAEPENGRRSDLQGINPSH